MSDNELNDSTLEPEETESEALWPSPGKKLQQIRENLGFSESKVAEALHMTTGYIRAMESDQYQVLPGKTFVKGYFKAYATYLNTDVEDIMTCYQHFSEAIERDQKSEAKVIQARKTYDQNKRWSICAGIIIFIVICVSWWYK